ncbi:xanthine dehydrogenase family protein molybdopterin-binding subunit [uncultured Ramlibacter sp.]|uniref:xanthine dehydrogenase family protein molybdopterin-binding subunit n=1 Tax=uncultured Ramlibacter sp. TaxID=260755 RepID=UPI0026292EF1|nr:xanthine dehydrogenase family protein molybdopterin-binding subunit [uncultured Ramlibacter sp.]
MNTTTKAEHKAVAGSSRRTFLKASALASGGLLMGVSLPAGLQAAGTLHTPNAWVHIADDNTITLISARSEMGQGVYTSMPMLIAEELNVDIRKIKVAIAPPNNKLYGNPLLGGPQLTGGSTSVRDGWEKLRIAGAQVREMLVSAAASKWNIDRSQLKAENGMVTGPGGRKATYGQLAEAASKLPVPEKVAIKEPKDFRIVGKRTPRLDTPAKTNGTAEFGIDVKLPGMTYAALEQCPVIGGTVKSFDAAKAKAMPGVLHVVQIPDGVAVVADSWWRANQARKQLAIQWDEGAGAKLNNAMMLDGIRAASKTGKPLPVKAVGDAEAVIAASQRVVRREYVSQLLSHSPLEPMNFTASYANGKMLLIGPTQWQDGAQGAVAKAIEMKPEDVAVQTTFLGGGFGRRIDLDFIVQAAQISKAIGKPVKLLWTREDDMTHDFYRPQSLHQMAAALGQDGKPTAMTFRMTSQSVTGRVFGLPGEVQDPLMTEAALAAYEIPAIKHDIVKHDAGLRVGYWRSVSHLLNAFANESFIDELAKEAGQDPYAYRMSMLKNQPRFANVLKLAADKAGWGMPLPAGRARGIALMEGYDTYMAQVAEISMEGGSVKVHKVTVAADLGRMVNPDTVEAQIQSSVVFGMGAALMQEITLVNGRVQQTNYHQFPVVRMNESPAIDIILVDSTEKPGGIGEPATAVVVPAIANAVATLTGKRVRTLPMTADAIKAA